MTNEDEIRDRFAATAMQGIIRDGYIGQWVGHFAPGIDTDGWNVGRLVAFEAYGFADAMMLERRRRLEGGG